MNRKSPLIICLIILFVAATLQPAAAQEKIKTTGVIEATQASQLTPFFAEEKWLSPPGFTAFWPGIAINTDDEIMVVYINEDGTLDIYSRISLDGGVTWSAQVKTGLAVSAGKAPDIIADDFGEFHMVYSDGGSSAIREVYYTHTINNAWQPRERVSFSVDNATWPAIAVDGDTIHVAWYEELGAGANGFSNIHYKAKTIGGTFPIIPENASNDLRNGHLYPDMKAQNGNVYLIYQVHQYEAGEVLTKYIAFKEKRQGVWQTTFELGQWAWPDIEVDAYGYVHALYPLARQANYRMRDLDGNWSGQVQINPKLAIAGFFDQVYRNNTMITALVMEADSNPERDSVYIMRRKFENNAWGDYEAPHEVDSGGAPDLPKLAFDSEGYVHIVWIDWTSTVDREPNGLYYNKFLVSEPDAPPIPAIRLDKDSLSYEFQEGESVDSQTVRIKNTGIASLTLNWQAAADQNWVTLNPASGTAESDWVDVTVGIKTADLEEGNYTATITFPLTTPATVLKRSRSVSRSFLLQSSNPSTSPSRRSPTTPSSLKKPFTI